MPAYFDTGFTVRTPAWHGLGAVLDDYPRSIGEARRFAGLNWEPRLVVPYQRRTNPVGIGPDGELVTEDEFVEIPHARIVERDDTGEVIGHGMSDRYQPITNAEMFGVLETLVDEGLKIETAGSVKGGAIVWALAYLDQPYTLPGDDSLSFPYLTVINSHDGKSAMRAAPTQVRVVCWNTVQAALDESRNTGLYYDFRHKGNVSDRIDEAKQAISGMSASRDKWIKLANELLGIKVTDQSYAAFVAEFLPEPPPGIATDRVRRNVSDAREQFRKLYHGEQNAAVNGSALALVNTAVEYLDHARGYRNTDTYLGRTILKPEPLKQKAVQIARAVCAV